MLEKKVEELEREFDTQTAEVKTIALQTKDNVIQLRYALQQLGAMLYNQETQKSSWREIRDIIMPTNQYWIDAEADDFVRTEDIYGNELVVNTSKWSTPTTKQGDDLEHRMDNLEAKLAQFGELFPKNCEEKLPECVEERKKSSASLCGNE
jgi:BMFP domain-containing protein YqiC